MKEPVTKKEFNSLRSFYQRNNVNYEIIKGGSTYTMVTPFGTYFYYDVDGQGGLPLNQLGFLTKVKSYVIKNPIPAPNYKTETDIKYFSYTDLKKGTVLKNVFALDIKSAYWQNAFNSGIINKALFDEGQTKDKRIRLASLGTFAKQKYTYTYSKGEECFKSLEKPPYAQVFFNNANDISILMEKCRKAINNAHILTWVDMIVARTDNAIKKCADIIADNGFQFKAYPVQTMERTYNAMVFDSGTIDEKPFYLPINQ